MDMPDCLTGPGAEFEADLGGRRRLEDVRISRIRTPVREAGVRGGVYASGVQEYRMRAVISDTAVIPLLTRRMLGPNPEFEQLRALARTPDGDYYVMGRITDSVQRPGSVEIGMTITEVGPA